MSRKDEIQKLIIEHNRHLRILKEKQASFGYNTPTHILTEIEDRETEIKNLQTELKGLKNDDRPISNANGSRGMKLTYKQTMLLSILAIIACFVLSFATVFGIYIFSNDSFSYLVRVQENGTGNYIANAKVTIEVAEQAPLDEVTDVNGVTRIFLSRSYAGQPGRLLVEANGYELYRQEIDLTEGSLPDTIPLNKQSSIAELSTDKAVVSTSPPDATPTGTQVIVKTPTDILEPTSTSTGTPIPPTTIPTNTPILQSTALLMDQAWSQDGLSAAITKFGLEDTRCGSLRIWGKWKLIITNNTEQDLVINLKTVDFTFVDNTGKLAEFYVMPDNHLYCSWAPNSRLTPPPGYIDFNSVKKDQSVIVRVYGIGTVGNQEWYEFGVTDAGRIQNVKWRIDIPR
ncbi:MAG: hypothetical protein GY797_30450 [Deltaproteobacteria bacterium]|nr:hypothetical protein [Deltaproteobacteria bacterium]